DNQTRLIDAALPNAEQRAHTLLTHPVRPEDLALQCALRRQPLGPRCELCWCKNIGRLVAEVAGDVLGLGENTSTLDRGAQRRLASAPKDRERLDLTRVPLRRALAVRVVLLII